jgi:hypothetical protein
MITASERHRHTRKASRSESLWAGARGGGGRGGDRRGRSTRAGRTDCARGGEAVEHHVEGKGLAVVRRNVNAGRLGVVHQGLVHGRAAAWLGRRQCLGLPPGVVPHGHVRQQHTADRGAVLEAVPLAGVAVSGAGSTVGGGDTGRGRGRGTSGLSQSDLNHCHAAWASCSPGEVGPTPVGVDRAGTAAEVGAEG